MRWAVQEVQEAQEQADASIRQRLRTAEAEVDLLSNQLIDELQASAALRDELAAAQAELQRERKTSESLRAECLAAQRALLEVRAGAMSAASADTGVQWLSG